MAKLEITLHEKGGDVTYKQHHISGQKYLDYWTMQEKLENKKLSATQIITLRLEYMASLFPDSHLSAEQVLKGLDPWEIEETFSRLIATVLGKGESNEKKEQ